MRGWECFFGCVCVLLLAREDVWVHVWVRVRVLVSVGAFLRVGVWVCVCWRLCGRMWVFV